LSVVPGPPTRCTSGAGEAIAQLKQAHDLDLRRKQDRLQLAHFAARRELDFAKSLPEGLQPVAHLPEENYYQSATAETETDTESASERYARLEKFTLLLLTGRILPSGPPLNGTQEAPAMRVLARAAKFARQVVSQELPSKREDCDGSEAVQYE